MFEKLNKLVKFDKPLKENSLIFCPKCQGRHGAKKWEREAIGKGLMCPRCRTFFKKNTLFTVDYFDREVETVIEEQVSSSKKVGAKAKVKAVDKLIRKDKNNVG